MLLGLRGGRVTTGTLVGAGIAGLAIYYLWRRAQSTPPELTQPVQPDSCESVGSAYGVSLCTGAVKPFIRNLPIVGDALGDLLGIDPGVNIQGCPYLTGTNKWRGGAWPASKEELARCIEWAKTRPAPMPTKVISAKSISFAGGSSPSSGMTKTTTTPLSVRTSIGMAGRF